MKHTYLLNIKRDVKTVYLVVSSITDPSLVRGGRAGGKKEIKVMETLMLCFGD